MAATGWYGAKRSWVMVRIRIAMPQIVRMRKKT
jgi:hypothetical protein